MKKAIAEKWVKALTSGEFQQTPLFLEHSGLNCANGVLCFLALTAGACSSYDTAKNIGIYDEEMIQTPESVLEWSGLKESGAILISALNDKGKSFRVIADYISNNWRSL